jgi:hypothetical protein
LLEINFMIEDKNIKIKEGIEKLEDEIRQLADCL